MEVRRIDIQQHVLSYSRLAAELSERARFHTCFEARFLPFDNYSLICPCAP